MYRIRFHGRGGQGIKTASRVLGSAFFIEGFEVQDAPRYGAERRGAPISAYVRASKKAINERGIIQRPDLVIVTDASLLSLQHQEILSGLKDNSAVLISSSEPASFWKKQLKLKCQIFTISGTYTSQEHLYTGIACIGASAKLCGVISKKSLEQAILIEFKGLDKNLLNKNITHASSAYDKMKQHSGIIAESFDLASDYPSQEWIDLSCENPIMSTPIIHATQTSINNKTGLWRLSRPVIDYDVCKNCLMCAIFCPDNAIQSDAKGAPQINYQHCKGCLICMTQCPFKAIKSISEHNLAKQNQ